MSRTVSRQIVNAEQKKWDQAIKQARCLLERVENRAARLRGAIETFTDLRDHGYEFNGPSSMEQI